LLLDVVFEGDLFLGGHFGDLFLFVEGDELVDDGGIELIHREIEIYNIFFFSYFKK